MSDPELDRIRDYYARRDESGAGRRYPADHPATRFVVRSRTRLLRRMLVDHGLLPPGQRRVLDIGCGVGGELRRFVDFGARPGDLVGVDLLTDRIARASRPGDGISFAVASGGALPFGNAEFDIVLLFTVLSSILDAGLRARVAAEALRVLRPGGAVVWYDFFVRPPGNHDVRAMTQKDIRSLFPGCRVHAHRATLLMPLTRVLAPRSAQFCELLQGTGFLNTHYLGIIRDAPSPTRGAS